VLQNAFRRKSQVLKLWDALAQLTKAQSLSPTQRYSLNHKSHKEMVGESFFGFGLRKTAGEANRQP
jgi:hypothetical protein